MNRILKRAVACVLTGALCLTVLCGCGGKPISGTDSGEKTGDEFVIGVAEAQSNREVDIRRSYFENFIAPTYHVRFIFSETLKNDAAVKTFIENCIEAGADAIIDFKSNSAQMARICEESGVYYTAQGTPNVSQDLLNGDFPLFTGWSGTNNEHLAQLFRGWMTQNLSENGSEGILIATSLAPQGNAQHIEVTQTLLQGLQEKYGLVYEQPIDDLALASDTINVANDKGILITLYPGSPNKDSWLPGISSLLESGRYSLFISCGQTYTQTDATVRQAEETFGIDVKVACIAALSRELDAAFNTLDPNGNPSVNFATVKPSSVLAASVFAAAYNALNGAIETACRDEQGKPANFRLNMIGISSPEELAGIQQWDDPENDTWVADKEFVDSLLVTDHPDITATDINRILANLTTDAITKMMS